MNPSKLATTALGLIVGLAPGLIHAAVAVSLVTNGGSGTSDTIVEGTATYSLDLVLDTDGNDVSGFQYHLETTPADAVTYGPTPTIALDSPFTSSDVFITPSAAATVGSGASGSTVLFKSSAGDYPAFNNAIVTHQFDTSALPQGTYVFTPVAAELTNSSVTITSFGTPGTFSLTVVPEPGSIGLLSFGSLTFFLARRRRR